MKRLLSMGLALCLLCGLGCTACAEGDTTLRVLDGWWAMERYQERYPDRAIESIGHFDENGASTERETILSGAWDAAVIDTGDMTLAELDALGLLLDLASNPSTAAAAEGLYPSIRAGCSAGDKLVALPAGFIGTRAVNYRLIGTEYWGGEDAETIALRQQLGFTEDDQPTTFAEVCQLGLRYMALSRDTRAGTTFLFSDSVPQGFTLLHNMILMYQTEATDENGEIEFDTPAFRAALNNADPLLAAFAADPKRTYGKDKSLYMVLADGIGVASYGVYPRVTEGTSIYAQMDIVIVNPNSKHLQEAIDYAVVANESKDDQWLLFYENADYDEALRLSYDKSIAAQKEQGEAQSVIDELEACKAAGDDKYFTPRCVFERYRTEIVNNLTFSRWKSIPTDDAIKGYLAGELDADGFIQRLNEEAKK